MGKNGRGNGPYLKPVTRIDLNTGNVKLRWIAVGVLLAIGIAAFAYGFSQSLNVQPGWSEVEYTSKESSVAVDFKFQYDFSDTGGSAVAVNKALIQCYSDAAVQAYRLLTSDVAEEGLHNMAYLNAHVNETVAVEPELYAALVQVAESESRKLFTAPARAEYDRVFLCSSDGEAELYDPAKNEEVRAWLHELAVYARDPEHIRLEVLGNNQVRLSISPEYANFAEEYGIETFMDFGWMRNAFAADMIADKLIEKGFTNGYLSSFDGFTRNLGGSKEDFALNLFNRNGMGIDMPARMHYSGAMSMVFLRNYPMSERDQWLYYGYESGEIMTIFLDEEDCMSKSSIGNLVSYSDSESCGEIVLAAADIFIADTFDEAGLQTLTEENVFSVWFQEKTAKYNESDLNLELLTDYTKKQAGQ